MAARPAHHHISSPYLKGIGRPQGSLLHFKMSHCYSVHSHVMQVQFLPVVVRLRLCYKPILRYLRHLGHLRHWGQKERHFVVSELVENFEEVGYLRHLGHLRHLRHLRHWGQEGYRS